MQLQYYETFCSTMRVACEYCDINLFLDLICAQNVLNGSLKYWYKKAKYLSKSEQNKHAFLQLDIVLHTNEHSHRSNLKLLNEKRWR